MKSQKKIENTVKSQNKDKRFKKACRKCFKFFKSKSFLRNIIVLAVCVVIAVFYVGLTRHVKMPSSLETIISFVFGLVLSLAAVAVLALPIRLLEDKLKVSLNDDDLEEFYGDKYKRTVNLGNTSFDFMYCDLYTNEKGLDYSKFKIEDDEKKKFKLDDFIVNNYLSLFSSHIESYVANPETIRLDSVVENKDNSITFKTSRSTYYNHLVTNRAIDVKLLSNLTLRSYYDAGPLIKTLDESMMSNHIGINAIVATNDEYILIPQRSRHATISKKALTSSIATRLTLPDEGKLNNNSKYVFNDCIIKYLTERLKLKKDKVKNMSIDVIFLGYGQNVYEGGKPQFYYLAILNDVNINNLYSYMIEDDKKNKKKKIDEDKFIFAINHKKMKFKNERIAFEYQDYKTGKIKQNKRGIRFERSFLANIYHYQQSRKTNPRLKKTKYFKN